ncbi:MAG TPA: conjugal transfer protein TraF [Vicinamibacterales bacterium]|nr:conjugal transfer protein TraF [Vicinamibacterales bacterium]
MLGCLLIACGAGPAYGQIPFEVAGARALGMGGAFVGVANDPTAVHWNPAGLASGSLAGMTIGWDQLHFGDPNLPAVVGSTRNAATLTSVATYPLGISYGYLRAAQVVAIKEDGTPVVNSVTVHLFGGTVTQTIVKGLVVGATAKYMRGQVATGETTGFTNGDALEEGIKRNSDSDGAFDLDAGVMATIGWFQAGFTAKNLFQPTFVGDAGFATQLKRRYRLGFAALPTDGLTLAFDVDLDTADPLVGLRRMMAAGGEFRLGPSLELRGGVRWSRDGDKRPISSIGASLKIRKGMWLDGYTTYSRSDDRGFGVAFRAGS